MNEKTLQKINEEASQFLGEGETVRHAVSVWEGPRMAMFLGILGGFFLLKQHLVIATDTHIHLMRAGQFAFRTPKALVESYPVGSVDMTLDGSIPWSRLKLAGRTLWVGKAYREDAEAVIGDSAPPE